MGYYGDAFSGQGFGAPGHFASYGLGGVPQSYMTAGSMAAPLGGMPYSGQQFPHYQPHPQMYHPYHQLYYQQQQQQPPKQPQPQQQSLRQEPSQQQQQQFQHR
jgi:hypothetical protein